MYEALGYQEVLDSDDYRSRYERGGIAKRIIEAYPFATWVAGTTVSEDTDPNSDTAFEQAYDELSDRLDILSRMTRADILAGLGRYAVILIGGGGLVTDELTGLRGPDDVLYLTPLPESRAPVETLVEDIEDPRFGLPESYNIQISSDRHELVHWTRVVHIAEGLLEDDVYGTPRLKAVWNYLDDLDKLVGGGAEAAWKRMDPGMQVELDPTLPITEADEDALQDNIEEFYHGLTRTINTRGVDLKMLAAEVSQFGSNSNVLLQLVSATTAIPHRILTGSERGELASSQDRSNWAARVDERRLSFGSPALGSVVDRLIAAGGLPEPSEYFITWPEADDLDESEKADVTKKFADANKAQVSVGLLPIVTEDEIRERVLGLEPLAALDNPPTVPEPDILAKSTDEDLDEPEWAAIHRAADAHVAELTDMVEGVYTDAATAINVRVLRDLLKKVPAEEVRTIAARIAWDTPGASENEKAMLDTLLGEVVDYVATSVDSEVFPALSEQLPSVLLSVLNAGGKAATAASVKRGSYLATAETQSWDDVDVRGASFEMTFDEANPRSIEWAETRSSDMIVEISTATKLGIRDLIAAGFRDGIPPVPLASRIRETVGLHSRFSRAVINLERRLGEAAPGAVVPAGPRITVRIPKTGADPGFIKLHSDRYAARLRNLRARTIARTEGIRGANIGQQEFWQQGMDSGQIPKTARKVWLSTPDDRTRKHHRRLHGKVVGITAAWTNPATGGPIIPGQEVNCRCSQALTDKKLSKVA